MPRAGEAGAKATLTYAQPDPDHATLQGLYDGKMLHLGLRKLDPSKSLLVTRGFHWINEFPFNR